MASEAIVSGVVADMVGRLMSLVAGQLRDRRGVVDEKLRRVRRLLVRIESAVEAAEARRITGRALLAWLSDLVDGAHHGRCFLDAFTLGDRDADADGGEAAAVANPLNPAKRLRVAARRLVFRGRDGAKAELDGVLADLESVSGDLTGFITMLQSCPPALHRPLATNIYADSQMFGRHVERRRVFDFLLHDGDGSGEIDVLSIVGRMGLGKTTLVQHACNDPEVRSRFSLIIEIDFHCLSLMSAGGDTALLLRSIFISGDRDNVETVTLLERKLRGVTFLAVFDNVDARRHRVIDAIMLSLRRAAAAVGTPRGGRRRSKVIVTSRNADHVTGLATASNTITLRPPTPAEYWFFFKAHAFDAGGEADADARLVAAGQAIARRLRLAASFFGGKMLAAVLRSRQSPQFWRAVLASGAADLPCLGYADEAVAGRVFPPHVTLRSVTMSRSPERGVISLQDSCLMAPPADSGRRRGSPELPVLLCKSVFPSYCLYYTAHCTIIDTDSVQ
uniref:NB-ARC domain-containing protein n=1 Tax=Leersia perrieri TaxID=77586 RepID=A0A0D9VDE8_9ORYZ